MGHRISGVRGVFLSSVSGLLFVSVPVAPAVAVDYTVNGVTCKTNGDAGNLLNGGKSLEVTRQGLIFAPNNDGPAVAMTGDDNAADVKGIGRAGATGNEEGKSVRIVDIGSGNENRLTVSGILSGDHAHTGILVAGHGNVIEIFGLVHVFSGRAHNTPVRGIYSTGSGTRVRLGPKGSSAVPGWPLGFEIFRNGSFPDLLENLRNNAYKVATLVVQHTTTIHTAGVDVLGMELGEGSEVEIRPNVFMEAKADNSAGMALDNGDVVGIRFLARAPGVAGEALPSRITNEGEIRAILVSDAAQAGSESLVTGIEDLYGWLTIDNRAGGLIVAKRQVGKQGNVVAVRVAPTRDVRGGLLDNAGTISVTAITAGIDAGDFTYAAAVVGQPDATKTVTGYRLVNSGDIEVGLTPTGNANRNGAVQSVGFDFSAGMVDTQVRIESGTLGVKVVGGPSQGSAYGMRLLGTGSRVDIAKGAIVDVVNRGSGPLAGAAPERPEAVIFQGHGRQGTVGVDVRHDATVTNAGRITVTTASDDAVGVRFGRTGSANSEFRNDGRIEVVLENSSVEKDYVALSGVHFGSLDVDAAGAEVLADAASPVHGEGVRARFVQGAKGRIHVVAKTAGPKVADAYGVSAFVPAGADRAPVDMDISGQIKVEVVHGRATGVRHGLEEGVVTLREGASIDVRGASGRVTNRALWDVLTGFSGGPGVHLDAQKGSRISVRAILPEGVAGPGVTGACVSRAVFSGELVVAIEGGGLGQVYAQDVRGLVVDASSGTRVEVTKSGRIHVSSRARAGNAIGVDFRGRPDANGNRFLDGAVLDLGGVLRVERIFAGAPAYGTTGVRISGVLSAAGTGARVRNTGSVRVRSQGGANAYGMDVRATVEQGVEDVLDVKNAGFLDVRSAAGTAFGLHLRGTVRAENTGEIAVESESGRAYGIFVSGNVAVQVVNAGTVSVTRERSSPPNPSVIRFVSHGRLGSLRLVNSGRLIGSADPDAPVSAIDLGATGDQNSLRFEEGSFVVGAMKIGSDGTRIETDFDTGTRSLRWTFGGAGTILGDAPSMLGSAPYVYDTARRTLVVVDVTPLARSADVFGDVVSGISNLVRDRALAGRKGDIVEKGAAQPGPGTVWVSGLGAMGSFGGSEDAFLPSRWSYRGGAIGVDKSPGTGSSGLRVGALAGYGEGEMLTGTMEGLEKADVFDRNFSGLFAGVYAERRVGEGLFVRGALLGGTMDHVDTRFVNDNLAPGGLVEMDSSYGGYWFAPEVTLGAEIAGPAGLVYVPSMQVSYARQSLPGYKETVDGKASEGALEYEDRKILILSTRGELAVEKQTGRGVFTARGGLQWSGVRDGDAVKVKIGTMAKEIAVSAREGRVGIFGGLGGKLAMSEKVSVGANGEVFMSTTRKDLRAVVTLESRF